jgi:hypothetical protein
MELHPGVFVSTSSTDGPRSITAYPRARAMVVAAAALVALDRVARFFRNPIVNIALIALGVIYAMLKLLGTTIPKVRTIADSVPLTIDDVSR